MASKPGVFSASWPCSVFPGVVSGETGVFSTLAGVVFGADNCVVSE
jgi:hypothetical protein